MFLNPDALAHAIPGCKRIEEKADGEFEVSMSIGIAAIKGSYAGHVRIEDKDPPNKYKMTIDGSGGPGFVNGEGYIFFEEKSSGLCVVKSDFEMKIGGKIAGIGQRMLGGVAKILAGQFFRSMQSYRKKQLKAS